MFFRSDESGTTENTTKFLSKAGNGVWKDEPAKAWTGTGEGKNKSSGVAEATASTKNSIYLHRVELRQGQQASDRPAG